MTRIGGNFIMYMRKIFLNAVQKVCLKIQYRYQEIVKIPKILYFISLTYDINDHMYCLLQVQICLALSGLTKPVRS